ncbi:MAG TPA: serine/threonine-protein kinase [Polyangia bacterium]
MIGQTVNNYRLMSLLGEGGMGAVYLAEHPYMGRKAAVKVLRREFAEDAAIVERFMNEARAANAIRHSNIIDIIDVGRLPSGVPYLMMEYLDGESLAQRLARLKDLSLADAVDIGRQVASALAAAHDKGIVHRDLKPDNIFLVRDESQPRHERVKVLDFGIAKLRGDLSGSSAKTQAGALMGTPPYMSPEQCRGFTDEIDQRTDVYALGIILYEMLCGAPPFVSQGWGEIVLMHLTREPEPPRARNASIPGGMEAIILKALAKSAQDRFASMNELEAALRTVPLGAVSERAPRPVSSDALGDTSRVPTSTTMRSATGAIERAPDEPPSRAPTTVSTERARRSRLPLVLAGATAAAAAIAGVLVFSPSHRQPPVDLARVNQPRPAPIADEVPAHKAETPAAAVEPAPAPRAETPPAPTDVQLSLRSDPPGATVIREDTGESLGVTPVELVHPRGPGAFALRLTKTGFAPLRLALPIDANSDRTVSLVRAHTHGTAPARPERARARANPASPPRAAPPETSPTAPPSKRAEKW